LEKAQDWVGITLTPSVLRKVPDLGEWCAVSNSLARADLEIIKQRLPWAAFVQPYATIPFHKDHPLENRSYAGFAIIPSDGDSTPTAILFNIERSEKALRSLKSLAPDPPAQSKYEHALGLLRDAKKTWKTVIDSANQQGFSFWYSSPT
jgi:hypothetical protein